MLYAGSWPFGAPVGLYKRPFQLRLVWVGQLPAGVKLPTLFHIYLPTRCVSEGVSGHRFCLWSGNSSRSLSKTLNGFPSLS